MTSALGGGVVGVQNVTIVLIGYVIGTVTVARGEGVKKFQKFCGHNLWMVPQHV